MHARLRRLFKCEANQRLKMEANMTEEEQGLEEESERGGFISSGTERTSLK